MDLKILSNIEQEGRIKRESYTPSIFNLKKKKDMAMVLSLAKENKIIEVSDKFNEQVEEFEAVTNLGKRSSLHANKIRKLSNHKEGRWVYFPWRFALIHILNDKAFNILRSSRNKNLIFKKEQTKYANAKIGIAGLNVGNPAALCIALEGGGRFMKFADNDMLSLSNLNRFRSSIIELGVNKAILSARQVYEIDPYYKIEVFVKGIILGKIREFLMKPKIDVLVEEMDNLPLKIEIREEARRNGIPVVMVTGNGEDVIIDIERFDQDQKLSLLNGYLNPTIIKTIKDGSLNVMNVQQKASLARDFMGGKFLTKRLRNSFNLVGTKLVGIPQIAESSFLRGAAVAYCVRQIVTGEKLTSGRYFLKLSDIGIEK